MEDSKVIDENLAQSFVEMGFSREEVDLALSRTDNNPNNALAFLLQDELAFLLQEVQVSKSSNVQEATPSKEPEVLEPHLLEDGDWEDVDEEAPEDPIKMMIAVNTQFKMSVGKTASQVAHAAVGLYSTISSNKRWWKFLHDWNESGSKKIVLDGRNTATLKSLAEKAKKMKLKYCAIRDTGLTEVPPNTLTAVAIFGRHSVVNKITGSLPLLK